MAQNNKRTSSGDNVYRISNTIYFYDEINRNTWMQFKKLLDEITNNKKNPVPEIILRISSEGGEICYAFAIASLIENSAIPINGIADGICNSAAVVLLLACNIRKATRCTGFLLHEGWNSYEHMNTTGLKRKHDSETELENIVKKYYINKSNLKSRQYDELQVGDGTTIYTDRALKYGIIDDVI